MTPPRRARRPRPNPTRRRLVAAVGAGLLLAAGTGVLTVYGCGPSAPQPVPTVKGRLLPGPPNPAVKKF